MVRNKKNKNRQKILCKIKIDKERRLSKDHILDNLN